MRNLDDRCTACGMHVPNVRAYHPYLYCELFKLGHADPGAYLASYGFDRVKAVGWLKGEEIHAGCPDLSVGEFETVFVKTNA